jgi:hypothetical protein
MQEQNLNEIKNYKAVEINGKLYSITGKNPEAIFYKEKYVINTEDYVLLTCQNRYELKKHIYVYLSLTPNKTIKSEYFLNNDDIYDYIGEDELYKIHPTGFFSKYKQYKRIVAFDYKIITKFNLFYNNSLHAFSVKSITNINKNRVYLKNTNYIAPIKKVGYIKGYLDWNIMSSKIGRRKTQILLGEFSPTFLLSEGLKYTFGVEIETSSGYIHKLEYNANNLNMSCDHDGSIKGGEYVTNVLTGDAGFKQLHKITSFLQGRCKIDKTCGIHVHIGGTVFNKSFSVFSYLLGVKLQNDLFKMLPTSRRHNKFCGDLPNFNFNNILKEYGYNYGVEIAYDYLFRELSSGTKLSKHANKKFNHPYGRYCGQYHDVEFDTILRYKWLNLVPCNFNVRHFDFHNLTKKEMSTARTDLPFTIEFRNHSASLNYVKIKNWVLICMAFVNYVENYKEEILKKDFITIEDIIKKVYKKNSKYLLDYIESRKNHFNNINEEVEVNNFKSPDSINFNQLLCV